MKAGGGSYNARYIEGYTCFSRTLRLYNKNCPPLLQVYNSLGHFRVKNCYNDSIRLDRAWKHNSVVYKFSHHFSSLHTERSRILDHLRHQRNLASSSDAIPGLAMAPQQRKIIFVTNSERGQSNICLAVAYEFLIRPEYEVHVASFAPLGKEVDRFNERAASLSSHTSSDISFDLIDGLSMKEAAAKRHGHDGFPPHGHGFATASEVYRTDVVDALTIWFGHEYLEIHDSIVKIIHSVGPDIIIVDPLFYQAIDACRTMQRPCIWLSPLSFKDHVEPSTWIQRLRRPAICSGYPYPVPWHLIIPNLILSQRLTSAIVNAAELASLNAYRNKHGLPGPLPCYQDHDNDNTHVLLPATPSIDFPCTVPPNIISCGPILLPDHPCATQDLELFRWLSCRPTVLINLGSHYVYDDKSAAEMVEAIHILLVQRPDIQVLWKMLDRDMSPISPKVLQPIDDQIDNDRVRVSKWLTVDPGTILQTGHVVCVIHHGGANSYYEAVKSGVIQIILPQWFDHYDFAARVEYLGIGAWASKKAAPGISGLELTQALQPTLCSPDMFAVMSRKAAEIARSLHYGREGEIEEGRNVACRSIIEIFERQRERGGESD